MAVREDLEGFQISVLQEQEMTFVHLSEILQQFEWVLKYEQELSQMIKGQS